MGSLGSNGGLIGGRRLPAASAAVGLWSMNEQVTARRLGQWPSPSVPYRYIRINSFNTGGLGTDTFDVTEIQLLDTAANLLTGITCTNNFTWTSGGNSLLVDGSLVIGSRSHVNPWSAVAATARLDFDLGSAKPVGFVRIYCSFYTDNRFPTSFNIAGSNTAGSGYGTAWTASPGNSSAYTLSSTNVGVSALLPVTLL